MKLIIIEPFYGGSHQVLLDQLIPEVNTVFEYVHTVTLSAKKWHWRARVSPLQVLALIPKDVTFTHLLTSSVMPLAELLGLCPSLVTCKKIIYFHENQLVYPIQEVKTRDVQYGYNQITACLAADKILFNSEWNKTSFLDNIPKLLKLIPDYRPKNIPEQIDLKSVVVYFPIEIPDVPVEQLDNHTGVPHIVWAHRWEHDKNPQLFFDSIATIEGDFQLSVLGESYAEKPDCFDIAKDRFASKIVHWGFLQESCNI